jgi:hypothetical protein
MDDPGHLDAWKLRQVEQLLARELQAAAEQVRLANLHLHDITGPRPSGAQWPDSKLEAHQARAACTRAHAAWLTATDRWVAFVTEGTVPEDLRPDLHPEDPHR